MIEKKDQIKYSWKWFEFHADQRLRAFYYYLIIIGALSWGYLRCLNEINGNNQIYELAPFLAFFAAIISLGFLCLEIRNVELVNIGRYVLADYGKLKTSQIDQGENVKLSKDFTIKKGEALRDSLGILSSLARFHFLFTHQFWLRFVYLVIFFFSLDRSDFVSTIWVKVLKLNWPNVGVSPLKELFVYILLPLILAFLLIKVKANKRQKVNS